ncbi:MAG: NADPH-dependent 7-cyano-7-deazaguanine reductase QueF, partial [Planctomycetota bacterium]
DFVAVCDPRWALLTAKFTPRGGISSVIKVEHKK